MPKGQVLVSASGNVRNRYQEANCKFDATKGDAINEQHYMGAKNLPDEIHELRRLKKVWKIIDVKKKREGQFCRRRALKMAPPLSPLQF